jgi:phosphate/sulfate permease
MGFSVAAKGFDSVRWSIANRYFLAWIISPLFAGSVLAAIFMALKYGVLRRENTFQRAYWTYPIFLTGAMGLMVLFVAYLCLRNIVKIRANLKLNVVLRAAVGVGAICGSIWLFGIGPCVVRKVKARVELLEAINAAKQSRNDTENFPQSDGIDDGSNEIPLTEAQAHGDRDGDVDGIEEGSMTVIVTVTVTPNERQSPSSVN